MSTIDDGSFQDRSLARSRKRVSDAATRSAEAITDALDVYRKAAQAEGGELRRIALREEFTIVLDTSTRMMWVALVVAMLYGVLTPLALYGRASTAVGVMLGIGMVGLLLLLFVHVMLFFFARSDQRTHSEVVTYNIGQTIATRLMGIETMRSFMRELAAFSGEFAPAAASSSRSAAEEAAAAGEQVQDEMAHQARQRIEDFLKRMALDQPLELFGLHKIKRKRERLGWAGGAMVAVLAALAVAALALSGVAMGQALGLGLPGDERLAMDDVALSSDGGASWSRGSGPMEGAQPSDSISPLQEVYHAPFGPRSQFGFVRLSEGSVLLMGGAAPAGQDRDKRAAYADVWRGEAAGARGWVSWTRVLANAPWGRRWGHRVVNAGGTLVLAGGRASPGGAALKDVWTSTDGGASWAKQADLPGEPRLNHSMAAVEDAQRPGEWLVVLAGGVGGSKVISGEVLWSRDRGASWAAVGDAANQPWGEREGAAMAFVPSGALVSAVQAEELVARIPLTADRTVGEQVLGAAELQTLPQAAHTQFMAAVEARAASMRGLWDGGNAAAPTTASMVGAALAAGAISPSAEDAATAEQKAAVNAMLGPSRLISNAAHLALMTKAHYATLTANDDDTKAKALRAAISARWTAPNTGTLVMTGGAPGTSDRSRGRRAPLEVFRSLDGGVTWVRVDFPSAAKLPTSRRGHGMTAGSNGRLFLAGGVQTARGDDEGRPLGDVWVSGDAGSTWQRVGSGEGRIDQVSSGPYDIPRRAYFGLAAVGEGGGSLLAVGGDATGMPRDEREAAGILAAGVNSGGAEDEDVVASELGESTKAMVAVAAVMVLLLLLLGVALHWSFYRAYYRDIPLSYVRTEKAWRDALEAVAASPDVYEVPGSFARIGRSVPQALRSIGSVARSMQSAVPGVQSLGGY